VSNEGISMSELELNGDGNESDGNEKAIYDLHEKRVEMK
jgi:hypothetical protein